MARPTATLPLSSFDNLLLPLALTNGLLGLPAGEWRFYFGIDGSGNGRLDPDTLVYEALELSLR